MKTAFITGISGQDGSYLLEYLLSLNYHVHGLIRRHSTPENQTSRIQEYINNPHLTLHYGDLIDQSSLDNILRICMPDEIYNLAAQSHVQISFQMPQYTNLVNSQGLINLLESYRKICPEAKFYQASSSEMFGNSFNENHFQNENTPMHPVSPYACSKLFGYQLTRNYRNSYNLFISNGILFNHESPRRGINFVTSKVVSTAVKIKLGLTDKLELGNIDSFRDWGHAKDYVKVMHKILNHNKPDDFVIATGVTHSVRELCEYVFTSLGMNYQDYVVQNQKYMRPEELEYLRGDPSKAKKELSWNLEYSFETLIDDMIEAFMKKYQPIH